jgi:hypothetical protein
MPFPHEEDTPAQDPLSPDQLLARGHPEPPTGVYLVLGEERVPLLPINVGMRLDEESGRELATWAAWVHPDWPQDVVFDARSVRPEIDVAVFPAAATITLALRGRRK